MEISLCYLLPWFPGGNYHGFGKIDIILINNIFGGFHRESLIYFIRCHNPKTFISLGQFYIRAAMKVKAMVMGAILLLLICSQNVVADDYVSHPIRIPLLEDFSSPVIKPGDSGTFTMSVTNRYELPMENITVTAELYASATYYDYTDIKDVESPPSIAQSGISHAQDLPDMQFNDTVFNNFTIKSSTDTTQGTYFMRFALEFDYNGSSFIMKSRGYFTDEEWDLATQAANDTHPGRIDIDLLGVDGIIPDSSFKVWEPIPTWPLYLCLIPLIVFLGIMALMFYAQEEYNMFPWLDKRFKYWSGKFHQSWRLLKHRFRKA
jgi:uncharacterized repeat protein (TIGR01451 family)